MQSTNKDSEIVCVCVCALIYIIYEDTKLYNAMGITPVLQQKRGL